MTDIEIARSVELKPIQEIAAKLGIEEENLEYYGKYKAKVNYEKYFNKYMGKPNGKIILVTAMSPTKYGEGKTTMSIGLADGIAKLGKKVCLSLREPSLGPVFGIKGGATGGGRAQVAPMEDINLHFTGDFHAIESANNLLCAMVDNHIYQGNKLGITKVEIKRCIDMNDRQLRHIIDGIGDKNGVTREDGFDITVASEVMACFCLARNLNELKDLLGNITVGYNKDGERVCAGDLKAEGAMIALLKDAIKPNLVQTLEGTPAFIHGGPFANIAHGCSSVISLELAQQLSDYVVTEAGFGADLGAEKYLDIVSSLADLTPSAIALVVTCRAVKHVGFENVLKHYENLTSYGIPVVVVVNKFSGDDENSIKFLENELKINNIECYFSNAWEAGGKGCLEAAAALIQKCELPANTITYPYNWCSSPKEKIEALVTKFYGAAEVKYLPAAEEKLKKLAWSTDPICIAKTQYSFSDNPELLGAPEGYAFTVRDVKHCTGAGFIVVYCGDIMTMPGLPEIPAAVKIDVDEKGNIIGIF